MPDDRRNAQGTGPRPHGANSPERRPTERAAQQPEQRQPESQQPDQARRRRSMEHDGGVSVADMVARNTGPHPQPSGPRPQSPPASKQPPPKQPPPKQPPPKPPQGPAGRPPQQRPTPQQAKSSPQGPPQGHPQGPPQGGPRQQRTPDPRRQPPQRPDQQPPQRGQGPAQQRRAPQAPPPDQRRSPRQQQPSGPQQMRPQQGQAAKQQPSGPQRTPQRRPQQPPRQDAEPGNQRQGASPPAPSEEGRRRAGAVPPPNGRRPGKPPAPRRTEMTDQMAPVDEATQYRRRIDDSIARFSAAHDEGEAEEAKRQERRTRMTAGPVRLIEETRTRLQRIVTNDDEDRDAGSEQAAAGSARAAGKASGSGESGHSRLQEKKRRRSDRTALTGRVAACFLAALVFLSTATAWGAKEWFNAKFNEVAALDLNSDAIHNGAIQVGDENFLIIGSDSRKGANAGANIGTAAEIPGARSDTVMLVHIPEDRHRVVVVSFLRDLEIRRPPCQRWDPKTGSYLDKTVPAARNVKLNTAYAVGGPKCITKVIQQITHVRIQHFVGLNFSGFQNMVAAVGGVTVDVPQPIIDRELGTVVAQAGKTHLEGKQALEFMRARKVIGDPTAGYGRIARQQQFIGALLDRMLSKDVLLDAGKLTGLVNAFTGATFGENIGFSQMLTLAQSMRKMRSGSIKFLTVPTTGVANQRGNEVLLEDKANALFSALIHGRPLPSEKTKKSQQAQASAAAGSQARPAQ